MEEYYYRRSQVPAFASWDWDDNISFTQCFESATQAGGHGGFFRCTFSESDHDRDLYVAGDLYENDVVTPAMIVVPRRTKTKVSEKEEEEQKWVSEYGGGRRSPNNATRSKVLSLSSITKPVDEDLYTLSPQLLYQKHTKKRGLSFFSSCLLPTCIA